MTTLRPVIIESDIRHSLQTNFGHSDCTKQSKPMQRDWEWLSSHWVRLVQIAAMMYGIELTTGFDFFLYVKTQSLVN